MAVIDSYVSYNIPCSTDVFFDISDERKVNVTLIDGNVTIIDDETSCVLPLDKRYGLRNTDNFIMRSKSDSIVFVRGNHDVYEASEMIGETRRNLFKVSHLNNSYTFSIEKGTKLLISVLKANSCVKLMLISGEAEILGCRLLKKEYYLPPESTYLVNSIADESFVLEIEGKNRGINILSVEDSFLELTRKVHLRLDTLRKSAKLTNKAGPIILVLGPPNVGKTSFCHFLANKAAEEGWKPVYIDLDVRRNSNTIPGAISIVVVEGQKKITGCFPANMKKILYFGSADPFSNMNLYYRLIFRLGVQLQDLNSCDVTVHSGVIIDACGSLSEEFETIYRILKNFCVERVFVIGDDDCFETLKESVLDVPSELICPPKIIGKRTDFQEKRIRENSIRTYFYGTMRNPVEPCYFEVKFSDIEVYSTMFHPPGETEEDRKVCFRRITSMNGIVDHVLGVSRAERVKPFRMLTEIKYFVWVSKVDAENGTVTLMSSEAVTFTKAILLMGDIKMDRSRPRYKTDAFYK